MGILSGDDCLHGDIRHSLETFFMFLTVFGVWEAVTDTPLGQGQGCCLTSYSTQNNPRHKNDLVPKVNSTEVVMLILFCFVTYKKIGSYKGHKPPCLWCDKVSDRVEIQNLLISAQRCGLSAPWGQGMGCIEHTPLCHPLWSPISRSPAAALALPLTERVAWAGHLPLGTSVSSTVLVGW